MWGRSSAAYSRTKPAIRADACKAVPGPLPLCLRAGPLGESPRHEVGHHAALGHAPALRRRQTGTLAFGKGPALGPAIAIGRIMGHGLGLPDGRLLLSR